MVPVFSQTATTPFKVATEPAFPPFEMTDQNTGELTGFDIDLMKAIGEEAGLKIEFESLPFDGIIPALQAGTVEAAISGMTITPERAQTISFSRPYFKAGLAIAVRDNNNTINSFEDLKNKKIAVQIGTTGAKQAGQIEGVELSTFDSAVLALQELVNGKVDAVVNDAPVTLYAIKTAGLKGVKVVGELVTEEYYGIALPKDSPYLQKINDALERLIANGRYQSIYEQWFGISPPELPLSAPSLDTENQDFNPTVFYVNLFRNLFRGAVITVILTAFSVFFGLIGGTLVALALISPYQILRLLFRIYVDFFRGTPMLVQLFIIYFGLPALFQQYLGIEWSLDRFPAAVMALSLNVAAYLAEIIRGGIQSIDKGQWEACESLGMTPFQTMQDVIFPQAFRRILPPLGNEFITLIKDTSLTAIIGFQELFREGQLIVAVTYKAFEVYIAVALVYLILTTLSSIAFKWLETAMNPLEKAKKKSLKSIS
ncbi:ABC transporter permease subunit [Gloeothece citriformis]|nr:ABC transporter permease subunit [Gloeothece citriformis]